MKSDWTKKFSSLAERTSPPEISWLMAQALEVPGLISLAAGFVDQQSLPSAAASGIIQEMLDDVKAGRDPLQYGTTQGDLELRRDLNQRLHREGVFHPSAGIDESHFLISSGSQQALYLTAEALLDEGDIVLLEAPTYFVVLGAFESRGARTIGIDTDKDGIVPEKLEDCLAQLEREGLLPRVKMLYLMTYSTNPMGISLAEERRKQVFDLLRSYRDKGSPILLIEDAAYRRLCFDGPELAPLKSLEEDNDFVLYTESFSKSLSPGLRLGFGVGPKALIDKMVDLKGTHDFGSSNFGQQILKRFLRSGAFDEHTDHLKAIYKRKRDVALEIFECTFPSEVKWLRPIGAFYIWTQLPPDCDTGADSVLFKKALEERVLYVPGALCYSHDRPESKRSSELRLAFGMIEEEILREGCERLARAVNAVF